MIGTDNMDIDKLGEDISIRLERRSDGRLWATKNKTSSPVRVTRCFPWSSPGAFISLRDERRREVCLIDDVLPAWNIGRGRCDCGGGRGDDLLRTLL